MQPKKMKFATKMRRVRLPFSSHNHLHIKHVFQNFCERYEYIFVFHDKENSKIDNEEFPGFVVFTRTLLFISN